MKRTQWISKLLYGITRILALAYGLTAGYGGISWATNTHLVPKGEQLVVTFPFSESSFLILDHNLSYLFCAFLLPVLGYTLFFWLLGNVFQVFYQERLFTPENIGQLQRFYVANMVLPILFVGLAACFMPVEPEMYMIVALHLLLGIFIFIISEIFRQGLHLQNEQDLYI